MIGGVVAGMRAGLNTVSAAEIEVAAGVGSRSANGLAARPAALTVSRPAAQAAMSGSA